MKTLSHGGWIRDLTEDEHSFAEWAESRGMEAVFEFFPEEVLVSLSLSEKIDGIFYARAVDVGDLPLGPQITVREYLEQRLRREHQALKTENGV